MRKAPRGFGHSQELFLYIYVCVYVCVCVWATTTTIDKIICHVVYSTLNILIYFVHGTVFPMFFVFFSLLGMCICV